MHKKILIVGIAVGAMLNLSCTSTPDTSTIDREVSSLGHQNQVPTEVVQGTWALPVNKSDGVVQVEGNRAKILLQVEDYDHSTFDRSGFWDGSGDFEHTYGGDSSGSFSYPFKVPLVSMANLEVRVRLSAESSTQGKPEERSDVELLINGHSMGIQTVIPDDGQGRVYSWKLAGQNKLKQLQIDSEKTNVLRFVVNKNAKNKHGLCIYGRSLPNAKVQNGQPIVLVLDTSENSPKERH